MPSALDDAKQRPGDAAIAGVLGDAKPHWDAILEHLDDQRGLTREWRFYGAKHGWQLKVTRGKLAVLYLIPERGSFTAALALRDDALDALRASRLPAALIREVESAKAFAEGRPARIAVTRAADVTAVRQLLAIKLGA